MSQLILTRKQSRAVDQIAIEEFGVPGIVLMENAGRNVADLLVGQSPNGQITILCGKGNNGGDGYVIARHLDNRGYRVSVILIEDPSQLTGDAAINFQIIKKSGIPYLQLHMPNDRKRFEAQLEESDWIVDALLGTGVQGKAREPYLDVIYCVNNSKRKVLAVDVPSGLDSDHGPVEGATIHATITATFVALKTGLTVECVENYTGQVHVIDIGVPRKVLTKIFDQQ